MVVEYEDFTRMDNKLYLKEEFVGSVVSDRRYKNLYRIKYLDGGLSEDFWNWDRVWDNFRKMEQNNRNNLPRIHI